LAEWVERDTGYEYGISNTASRSLLLWCGVRVVRCCLLAIGLGEVSVDMLLSNLHEEDDNKTHTARFSNFW
jgi:hypothetical protein